MLDFIHLKKMGTIIKTTLARNWQDITHNFVLLFKKGNHNRIINLLFYDKI